MSALEACTVGLFVRVRLCARHVRLMLSPCLPSSLALANTAGCSIIIKKCSAAPFLLLDVTVHLALACMCVCVSVGVRPSDCLRFICLLNETRIFPQSLENPAEFSLHQGTASVGTVNGNPQIVCTHTSV